MSDFTWTETPNNPSITLTSGPFTTLHFTAASAIDRIIVDVGLGIEECAYRDNAFRGPYVGASTIDGTHTIVALYRTGGWPAAPKVYPKTAANPDESFTFYFPSYAIPAVSSTTTSTATTTGGFGTGPFGSIPFGSAVSSTPTALSIVFAEAISVDTIRVHLNLDAVVDDEYKKKANYSVIDSHGNKVEIRDVMWPVASDVYPYVQLHVRNMIEAETYSVDAMHLLSRSGLSIDGVASTFTYLKTKVDSVIHSLPDIYDTRALSNIRAMLTAIGYEDNIIAGSLDGIEENA